VRETVEIVRTLLRDGGVTHRGSAITIERFDLWFTPLRREIPIYLAALFPTMLEVCGELAQGVLLTWATVDAGRRAAEHVAVGARRAGRKPEDIDIASLLPCHVAASQQEARERMRPAIALYAGFFPRYNRLLAASGFPEATAAIKAAWDRGDREGAARLVPDALVDAVAVAGTAAECRERVERYRRAGLALPIISPRVSGPDGRRAAMEAIRACAP
jgi:alkanesulfonate monooxygenase SsuD/methylene tetrahydromethanopterin reductase-like flavin-dependent oxidoreductase (luciferase family)